MTTVRTGRPINVAQLAVELAGRPWQLDGDELTVDGMTEDELYLVVAGHDADAQVPPPPPPPDPLTELRAAIGAATTLDELKAALLAARLTPGTVQLAPAAPATPPPGRR